MKHIALLAATIALILSLQTSAQINIDEKSLTDHHIGLNVGPSTGIGISYRYWPGKLGVQTTLAGIVGYYGATYNAAFTFLYELNTYEQYRFFTYQGNNFYNNWGEYILINSLGFGVEKKVNQHIGINGMFGFANYSRVALSMTGEVGIFFRL